MKTIRLLGIVLLTVLMSVSYSACGGSSDDDSVSENNSEGGKPSTNKQLVKMTITNANSQIINITEFTYNNDGKLKQYKVTRNRTDYIYNVNYSDNSIIEVCNGLITEYTLEKGSITKVLYNEVGSSYSNTYTYTYDNNNNLATKSSMSGNQTKYIWSGGNPVRVVYDSSSNNSESNIEYSSYIAPPGFDHYFDYSIGRPHYNACYGMLGNIGNTPRNLISKISSLSRKTGKIVMEDNYKWVLEDGIPVLAILTKYEKSTYETYTITYEWK